MRLTPVVAVLSLLILAMTGPTAALGLEAPPSVERGQPVPFAIHFGRNASANATLYVFSPFGEAVWNGSVAPNGTGVGSVPWNASWPLGQYILLAEDGNASATRVVEVFRGEDERMAIVLGESERAAGRWSSAAAALDAQNKMLSVALFVVFILALMGWEHRWRVKRGEESWAERILRPGTLALGVSRPIWGMHWHPGYEEKVTAQEMDLGRKIRRLRRLNRRLSGLPEEVAEAERLVKEIRDGAVRIAESKAKYGLRAVRGPFGIAPPSVAWLGSPNPREEGIARNPENASRGGGEEE